MLANTPEYPTARDQFNLSLLQPLEGKMEPRWINLYGLRPEERIKGQPQANSLFIGRVLMSLHLLENENP